MKDTGKIESGVKYNFKELIVSINFTSQLVTIHSVTLFTVVRPTWLSKMQESAVSSKHFILVMALVQYHYLKKCYCTNCINIL